jgi:hypothetical protein
VPTKSRTQHRLCNYMKKKKMNEKPEMNVVPSNLQIKYICPNSSKKKVKKNQQRKTQSWLYLLDIRNCFPFQ